MIERWIQLSSVLTQACSYLGRFCLQSPLGFSSAFFALAECGSLCHRPEMDMCRSSGIFQCMQSL